MKYYILFFTIMFSLFSCKKTENTNDGKDVKTEEIQKEATVDPGIKLPGMTQEFYLNLLKKCDQIDVIFNHAPISMSQSSEADVKGSLGFLSPGDITIANDCKELGTMLYLSKGELIGDARLYFGENACHYLVFYEGNKKVFGSLLNERGISFFNQVLQQSSKKSK